MSKKNVLGSDPFEWLKGSDKKENTENKKSNIGDQKKQTEKPSGPVIDSKETDVKQEVHAGSLASVKAEKDIEGGSAKSKIQGSKATDSSNIEKALKRNDIKWEPAGISGSSERQEEEAFVPSDPSDISEVNRKTVLGEDLYAHHAKDKSRKTTQKDSPATAFVIVYTVLLLILGFIIYKDMTKQIDRLETKLELIEKKLDAGIIEYYDTESDKW